MYPLKEILMNHTALLAFLLEARANTYVANAQRSTPALPGSRQFEFTKPDWLYRDVYYQGNGLLMGIETIFLQDKPVWSMSYFGDFSKMTETQVDRMLRKALLDNRRTARINRQVEKDYGDFTYSCAGAGSLQELAGMEEICVNDKEVYFFHYAGGSI
jgi:hypothetical protein